ncbi:MAG: imidazolonepropionase, partial [Actinomycetota bacterium]|nr:imidazolonepropionase [Actinomycetota bacterium]
MTGDWGPATSLFVFNIGSLVTNDPDRGGLLGIVEDAAVAIVDDLVAWVGPEDTAPGEYRDMSGLDAGGAAALPGFVDPHTHLVFAGDRSDE